MVADVDELYHFGISIFDAEIKVGKVDRGRFGDEIGGDRDLAGYRRFDLFVFDKQKFVVFTNNLFEGCVVLGVKVAVVVSCPESLEFGRDEHFLLQHLDALVQLVALVKVKVYLVDPFALALRRFALAFRTFFAHLFQQLNSLQLVLDSVGFHLDRVDRIAVKQLDRLKPRLEIPGTHCLN